MQVARYKQDYFDLGEVKYAAGKCYPIDDETRRHIDLNAADEITITDDPAEAAQAATEMRAKADASNEKAEAARTKADALVEKAQEAESEADVFKQ